MSDISERQRQALSSCVQAGLNRVPDFAYETVRKLHVGYCVLASDLVPQAHRGHAALAWFDPEVPAMYFNGPYLICLPPAAVEVIAIHECAHSFLWAAGEPWWRNEELADEVMYRWGIDPAPLEYVRFANLGRRTRRFLSVGG
jgi:hypothetical protein